MKTFKQYILESGTWGSPLSPWLPYPNSGGKNVVTPGSIKPPKRPVPTSIPRGKPFRDGEGRLEWPEETWPPTDISQTTA